MVEEEAAPNTSLHINFFFFFLSFFRAAPSTLWFLVRFVFTVPRWELHT